MDGRKDFRALRIEHTLGICSKMRGQLLSRLTESSGGLLLKTAPWETVVPANAPAV